MGEIDTSPEDVSRFKDEWAKLERESLTAGRDAALAHVEWWRDKCAEADDLAQALAARVAELEISLEAKESAAQSALNDAWAERDEIQRNLTAMQESAAEFLCDREAARAEAARLREALRDLVETLWCDGPGAEDIINHAAYLNARAALTQEALRDE